MDILIIKDHMQGNEWVFAGTEQFDIDATRAADLMRNGLAQPLVVQQRPQDAQLLDKPAAPAKAAGGKGKKPNVQTSAQPVPEQPAKSDGAGVEVAGNEKVADSAGDGKDGADVQTSAQEGAGTDADAADSGGGDAGGG